MAIGFNPQSRRQFLVGAGKSLLLLPCLPSLLARELWAANITPPKRFMAMGIMHYMPIPMWVDPALATTSIGSYGAKVAQLSTMANPNLQVLASSSLYNTLRAAGKLSLIYGLDPMIDQAGHGQGGALMLSGSLQGSGGSLQYYPAGLYQTIDAAMEGSATLYPAGSTSSSIKKAIRVNYMDSGFDLCMAKSGGTYANPSEFLDAVSLYNQVFSSLTGTPTPTPSSGGSQTAQKTAILNQVYASYASVVNGRKISAGDKTRLNQHMQMLSDLNTQIAAAGGGAGSPPSVSCTQPNAPAANLTYGASVPITMNLLALAFKCGLTKVATFGAAGHSINGNDIPGLPTTTGYHNGVVHSTMTDTQKFAHYVNYAKFHTDALAIFLNQMNVQEPGTNSTYLDNMLTVFQHEQGSVMTGGAGENHPDTNYMAMTIGTMGGYFKSDKLLNYGSPGAPYNSLLISYLQAMGLKAAEYEAFAGGAKGWGPYTASGSTTIPANYLNKWGNQLYNPLAELFL